MGYSIDSIKTSPVETPSYSSHGRDFVLWLVEHIQSSSSDEVDFLFLSKREAFQLLDTFVEKKHIDRTELKSWLESLPWEDILGGADQEVGLMVNWG